MLLSYNSIARVYIATMHLRVISGINQTPLIELEYPTTRI